MTVFENIKEIIQRKKSNVKEVAKNISMSEKGLGDSLRDGKLKVATLLKIAEFLKVSPEIFFQLSNKNYLENGSLNIANEENVIYGIKKENEMLKTQVKQLEKIVELMEKK